MTLVSNNCAGGAILHSLGMEFRTPTILLQILPEQYPKFCERFAEYMQKDLVEVKASDLDHQQEIWLNKMFGGVPDMPFGLLGDILVCFQHYATFEEAKGKWNERRARIDFSDVSFLMHARGEEYREAAEAFLNLRIGKKLLLTEGFDVPGGVRFDGDGFDAVNGQLRITTVYDFGGWLNGKN